MKNLTRIMFNVEQFGKALGTFSAPDIQRFLLEIENAEKMPRDYGLFIAAVQGFPPAYRNQLKEQLVNALDQRYVEADSYILDVGKKRKSLCPAQ